MEIPAAEIIGRIFGGHVAVIITSAPLFSPDAPTPDTARPAIIWLLDCAVAEITFPSSKMRKKAPNVYLSGK
jgi:hypothetical protein